ncbi:hypothetical protein BJ742DRAFT_816000 [Cladochytrium replicatum]|nr:hypothetical protein BJ742DRAFT_816000 [Cladochytrium replicatum]
MPVTQVIEIDAPTNFEASVAKASESAPGPVFVVVYGKWCGDSIAAKPVLETKLAEDPRESTLIYAYVDRAEWRSSDVTHPYKIHPRLKTVKVPTLYAWEDGRSINALVETDVAVPDLVTKFIQNPTKFKI